MRTAHYPPLEPGRVYRPHEFSHLDSNTTRATRRYLEAGQLRLLRKGLYLCPRESRFGALPASDAELVRGFLEGAPHVFTGPERWNALGLGSTAMFARRLVYNQKRTGSFEFGGKKFVLKRIKFPETAPVEWFVVDLLENAEQAGVDRNDIATRLTRALIEGRFDRTTLAKMAGEYGTKTKTRRFVGRAIHAAQLAA
jgi:hypothetical protein